MKNNFDITSYLDSRDIAWWADGRNIGREDIGIDCLFCDDVSHHMNIHREKGIWHCWSCDEKGNIFTLVKRIEPKGADIREILKEFFVAEFNMLEKQGRESKIKLNDIARELILLCDYREVEEERELRSNFFYPLLQKWGDERGFDRSYFLSYGAMLPSSLNNYFAYRLVVPIFENKGIVNYVGRDLTGLSKLRYLAIPNGVGIKNYKDCIYNAGDLEKRKGAVIVEGIFDVWRLNSIHMFRNYAVVATFGKSVSREQKQVLFPLLKDMIEVVICFDGGSKKESERLAQELRLSCDNISIVSLPEGGDPDSLGRKGTIVDYFMKRERVI